METGTLVEGKQQEKQPAAVRDSSQKDPAAPDSAKLDAAKAKDGKMESGAGTQEALKTQRGQALQVVFRHGESAAG